MFRVFGSMLKWLVVIGLVALIGLVVYLWRSPDPKYTAYETFFRDRFHRYDDLIRETATQRGIDPMLLKAVVWRESRFDPGKTGVDGERGLMQITDKAALEWVKGEKVPNFAPGDLYDPKVNLQAGSWLLAQKLRRYEGKDDPVPFALAEYNAGRSRVVRWTGERNTDEPGVASTTSQQFLAKIDFPSTKSYITTVQDRVRYYHERGKL